MGKVLAAAIASEALRHVLETRGMSPALKELEAAVAELVAYMPRVSEAVLSPAVSSMNEIVSTGGGFESGAPWAGEAALTKLDFQAWCRDSEARLERLIFGRSQLRAASDVASLKALKRLPMLAGVAHTKDPERVDKITAQLLNWPRRMRGLLDELRADEQPWTRAPRGVDCPQCGGGMWLPPDFIKDLANTAAACRRCKDENGVHVSTPATIWASKLAEPTQQEKTA